MGCIGRVMYLVIQILNQSAIFVDRACPAHAWAVGFLNVLLIRLRSLLLAESNPLKAKGYLIARRIKCRQIIGDILSSPCQRPLCPLRPIGLGQRQVSLNVAAALRASATAELSYRFFALCWRSDQKVR